MPYGIIIAIENLGKWLFRCSHINFSSQLFFPKKQNKGNDSRVTGHCPGDVLCPGFGSIHERAGTGGKSRGRGGH